MHVLSVNVSALREVPHDGSVVVTGIYKSGVAGAVEISSSGLVGDRQADLENHGGVDKAVYVYSFDNYAYWQSELAGDALPYGAFGENLTVSGLTDDCVNIGDVLRIGAVLGQVTQPRVPCFKLGIRMGSKSFPKRFMRSGRCGFYLRVLVGGLVRSGDVISFEARDAAGLTIQEAMLACLPHARQHEVIRKALQIPGLSAAWREDLSKRLLT